MRTRRCMLKFVMHTVKQVEVCGAHSEAHVETEVGVHVPSSTHESRS